MQSKIAEHSKSQKNMNLPPRKKYQQTPNSELIQMLNLNDKNFKEDIVIEWDKLKYACNTKIGIFDEEIDFLK